MSSRSQFPIHVERSAPLPENVACCIVDIVWEGARSSARSSGLGDGHGFSSGRSSAGMLPKQLVQRAGVTVDNAARTRLDRPNAHESHAGLHFKSWHRILSAEISIARVCVSMRADVRA